MRGFVRMTSAILLGFSLLSIGILAGGTASAADRRVIVTPEADYSGFDYNTIKDTDLAGCQKACLADSKCRAFTFNTKAGWCFLKSDNGILAATPGATAGRVVDSIALTPSTERQRLGELNFADQTYIDEARTLASSLKNKFDPGTAAYLALRTSGGDAYRAGRYDDAARDFGKALAIADDNPPAWLDFSAANLRRNPDDWSQRQDAWTNATAAAISAYLRSSTPEDRAEALAYLGDAFAKREAWKPAYRAYRASLALRPNDGVQATYDKVIAEHGFRITSNEVDADAANPRICVVFSDKLPVSRADLADYVTVEGGTGLSIEPEESQICVDGVTHGSRYKLRVRQGLPAADGETLAHPADIDVYVRDRDPWVGFAGNAYVLPAGRDASIPIVSVNTDKAKATIYRIGDRALGSALRDGDFLRQLNNYSASQIGDDTGAKVWEGEIGITSKLNETVTTAIPIAQAVPQMKPGVYVITARAEKSKDDEWGAQATQWFVVSDLGITTLSGHDGVHAIVRSLASAQAIAGAKVRLIATNNDVLGEGVTDAEGHVRFDPGLARGTGGMAPQLVDVATDAGDYAFLDMSRSAFDLTDRGVDGRPAPQTLDVFLTPERGIYRPGETVHLTALMRDPRAIAVSDLPLTLVVERPDGVEFYRKTLNDGGLGGYSADVALEATAMRGSWQVKLFADPKGTSLAETSVLVEDFEPERLAFELTTEAKALTPTTPATIDLEARYLYGAPAPDLSIEGTIEVKPVDTLAAFPGYKFGLKDDTAETVRDSIAIDAATDADGKARFDVALPELPSSTKPFTSQAIIRIADTNGRAVERKLALPVANGAHIGIRPLFEEDVPEGGNARFEVILVGADGARIAKPGLAWRLDRIESDYQWYRTNGNWNYDVVTKAQRVSSGTLDTVADSVSTVEALVNWGQYRLTVEDDSGTPIATSVAFYAGWYTGTASSDTPDVLKVGLDKPAYRIGETVKLRLDPRFGGIALISVIDDRLISMKTVEVPESGTTVDLTVTEDWGPGAYVTAALYRPMDIEAKRMPARALGLTWAKVAPGDRQLSVGIGTADEIRPRGTMTIPVSLDNLAAGTEAYVTVAAVDVGILNLTNFKSPAPDQWYFGQRKLGMDIRDLYGQLINRMQGVPGTLRSGGDGGPVRLSAPPPTQKLLAFYSGIVQVDAAGKATVSFEVPDFNGTVRVMVMAWSKNGVGSAAKDVLVRDPVVVTASIPRFLSTGDTSRLLVEVNNVSGPAGDYGLTVAAGDGIGMAAADKSRSVTLAEKQRLAFNIPISGDKVGDFAITVTLATPAGESFPTELTLGVRPPGEPVTRQNLVAVAAGGTLTVSDDTLAEFVPGTTSVAVSLGGAGPLDVAGILGALDRYPYGCTEQTTSRALPLVYLDDVAISVGIGADAAVKERVQKAIVKVLGNQAANGSFGLWGPENTGDLWLDAYVTDFLTRAADKGYDVPAVAKNLSLDNLANRISYAQDFSNGGEDIAYALYVLARTGRAAIGDLRYYAETKLSSFRTPLAKAQIGAALGLYGDRQRAANAFSAALADLNARTDNASIYRADYGTLLRDEAAVLTLAAESKTEAVNLRELATRIAATDATKRYTSTQENAWMLLAAAALIKDAEKTEFTINGETIASPLFRRFTGTALAATPVAIQNKGSDSLQAVVATTGVPSAPEPAGGTGFKIERTVYTPEGEETDITTVGQNDRFLVVLTVTQDASRGGKVMIVDPIPAGFEIENPNISASGDTTGYAWLDVDTNIAHTEARTDRFVAALDRSDSDSTEYSVAYSVRAVSPGTYARPAATVEDMYRPDYNARTETGTTEVVGVTR